MLAQVAFIFQILRLTPLFLIVRIIVLIVGPGIRYRTTPLHELGFFGFCLYLSCVCFVTVNIVGILHGHFDVGRNYNLIPFAEITGIASGGDPLYALLNIGGNVVMFLPLGFLLPLLWCGWRAGRIFLASLFLSGGIEVLQFFTSRSADIDDVILNTLGGVIGYLMYCIIRLAWPGVIAGFRLRLQTVRSCQKVGMRLPENKPTRPDERPQEAPRAPQMDQRCAKHGRRFRRTALVTMALALVLWGSGTVLLSGFSGYAVWAGQSRAPAVQRQLGAGPIPQADMAVPAVNSANVLLATADMAQILYEKRADQRIYPASLTKMMTAVLALESIADLEEAILLGEETFAGIYEANLSTAGFQPGEEVRALDLVCGVMLPSGAECSVALARHIAGSEQAFAAQMNEKARELGMTGTHFVNATGSHHTSHYTTAGDMALLLGHALENPLFYEMAALDQYRTAPTNVHPEGVLLASTLFGKTGRTAVPGGALIGGKTGYTDEAGQCLASFAEIGGREYILITAGARPEDFRLEQLHIEDAFTVYGALGEIEGAGVV